jgi:anti-sigma B factor antagonist
MALAIQARSVGEITILACSGRIVEGDESAALHASIEKLLPRLPYILLDLAGVSFVDSAGLGTLLRLRALAQAAGGDLKICAVNSHFREVLRTTKLLAVLVPHESDEAAITAFYTPADVDDGRVLMAVDVLCVHASPDIAAYARELLRQAGYGTTTATNLSDARVLMRATTPSVVVIPSEWQANFAALTGSGGGDQLRIVLWPPHFSTEDAGDAAQQLLAGVASGMAGAG